MLRPTVVIYRSKHFIASALMRIGQTVETYIMDHGVRDTHGLWADALVFVGYALFCFPATTVFFWLRLPFLQHALIYRLWQAIPTVNWINPFSPRCWRNRRFVVCGDHAFSYTEKGVQGTPCGWQHIPERSLKSCIIDFLFLIRQDAECGFGL